MVRRKEQPQASAPRRRGSVGGKPAHLPMRLGDGRQFKAKSRALVQPGTDGGERASVRFSDRFTDRQPEPEASATGALLKSLLELEEWLEETRRCQRDNPD